MRPPEEALTLQRTASTLARVVGMPPEDSEQLTMPKEINKKTTNSIAPQNRRLTKESLGLAFGGQPQKSSRDFSECPTNLNRTRQIINKSLFVALMRKHKHFPRVSFIDQTNKPLPFPLSLPSLVKLNPTPNLSLKILGILRI